MPDRAYLEITTDKGTTRHPLGRQPVSMGRHPQNSIIIRDDEASRRHCVIEPCDEGGYQMHNLKSRNGTHVNGDRTRGCNLNHDDVIRIGTTEIRISLPAGAGPVEESTAHGHGIDLEPGEQVREQRTARRAPQLGRKVARIDKAVTDGEDIDQLAQRCCQAIGQMTRTVPGKAVNAASMKLINARGDVASGDGDEDDDAGAIPVLRAMLGACVHLRATDVHIEPKRSDYQSRLRVDGMMVEIARLPKEIGIRLASLVKVLGDIDIAQKNIVQEGTFSAELPGRHIDYRVSLTPTTFGQKLVIRVLSLANAPQFLSEMNVPPWSHKALREVMQQDAGMVLVSGPTGSGKTTSLYALIREINIEQRNVVTIEDPVEYHIDGVTQIPINEMKGNSFSNVLRSVLRQDPDVILVGEVRDTETARIAMQAAITGHLVLSTVHARDTIGAIFRLLDLGVEPYVVGSGLNLVLAQRLVRKLCPHCRLDKRPAPEESRKIGVDGLGKIYKPSECEKCLHTGYVGRQAVFELLTANDAVRDVILATPTIQDLKQALERTMFVTLAENGYKLVAEGETSIDEIDRVVGSVE